MASQRCTLHAAVLPRIRASRSCVVLCLALLCSLLASAQHSPPAGASSNFAALSTQADAARDANRLDDAVVLYKKALALRPGWAEGWWSLGTIQYDQNSYAAATAAFQKTVALAPRNGTAFVMLGLSEFELGRDVPALKHLEKGSALGLSSDPQFQHVVIYHEGVLLQRAGKFESAQELLQQLCLQGVESDEVSTALGLTLLRMRSQTAPPRGSAPADIVARVGHAACLSGQRKFDDARRQLQAVVTQYPAYPGIHYAFGLVLLEASDNAGAIAEFKAEIANYPQDVVSHLEIAAADYKLDSAAGLPFAEEAVKLAPREPFAHYLLGLLLLDTDDYLGAIPELEIAQQAFPHDTRIYLALGSAYSRAGRKQDAARERATFERFTREEKKSDSETAPGGRIPVGNMTSSPQ